MPKKKAGMTPEEQSQSFNDAVKRMIDAGELNPTEADAAMERVMRGVKTGKIDGSPQSSDGCSEAGK